MATPYEGHALDEITIDGTFQQARSAAEFARVTGSVGATLDGFKVERVAGPVFRVPGRVSDIVIVLAGTPGQYTSHALNPVDQELLDAVAVDEVDESYLPDEDYFRSIVFREDI